MISACLMSSLTWCGTMTTSTPAPVLVSLNYDTFDNAGGDSITITGTDLGSALAVWVGPALATITANTPTTVTFTTPSLPAGTYDVTVVVSSFASNALTIEAYDLAGNSFSAWHRAPYAGSPFSSTASAGTSGAAADLSEATNPPSVGTAVNGYAPMDFDGVNDVLSGNASSNYVTTGAGTLIAFVYIDTVASDTGLARTNRGVVGQANVFFGMNVSTSGLRSSAFDTAHRECGPTACSTGAWHLLMMRWNGSVLEQSVDVGTAASVACTGPSTLVANFRVGVSGGGTAFFDGRYLEIAAAKTYTGNTELTKIHKCFKCRYAL